jgi:alpha-glucosidase
MSYIRHDPYCGERILILLNFNAGQGRAGASTTIDLDALGVDISRARLLISNDDAKLGSGIDGPVTLDKWCGRVYLLDEVAEAN